MKKILFTLTFSLLGIEAAKAHTGHKSISHMHMTESISFGITSVLAITFIIISIILTKKQLKKNKNHAV
jgi:uncharacterized membrane protein AbrB (regulator of aidB expression)